MPDSVFDPPTHEQALVAYRDLGGTPNLRLFVDRGSSPCALRETPFLEQALFLLDVDAWERFTSGVEAEDEALYRELLRRGYRLAVVNMRVDYDALIVREDGPPDLRIAPAPDVAS